MDFWTIVSKTADIIGILVGVSSLIISAITLRTTTGIKSGIRKSKLISAESSDYAKEIDEHINDLEAYRKVLLDGKDIPDTLFPELAAKLGDINIAYETILPQKLHKQINDLESSIYSFLKLGKAKQTKQMEVTCASKLVYIIAELKKEKKIL